MAWPRFLAALAPSRACSSLTHHVHISLRTRGAKASGRYRQKGEGSCIQTVSASPGTRSVNCKMNLIPPQEPSHCSFPLEMLCNGQEIPTQQDLAGPFSPVSQLHSLETNTSVPGASFRSVFNQVAEQQPLPDHVHEKGSCSLVPLTQKSQFALSQ